MQLDTLKTTPARGTSHATATRAKTPGAFGQYREKSPQSAGWKFTTATTTAQRMSPSEPRKRGMTTCKTCDEKVSGTQRFWCFSCGVVLHMTPECTGFLASVVKSFREMTINVLLLCHLCAENERETLIQDVYATRMNRLEEENNHKLQAIQDKLDEYKMNVSDTYASVVALKKETENIASKLEQPV